MAAGDHLGQQFAGMSELTAAIREKSDYSNWCSPSPGADSLRRKIEWVPTNRVAAMRDFSPSELRNPGQIPGLAEDIKQHGFKSPLLVMYGQNQRRATLGEGNHRLAAAEKLGLTHVPVHVLRQMEQTSPRSVRVRGAEPDWSGYVPGNMAPHEIGLI